MNNEFVNWDDLDVDYCLGEKNWTDDEEGAIWGYENEWDSDDNGDDVDVNTAEKENKAKKPAKKRARKITGTGNIYQCPICNKEYKSTSGFRGHVMRKHERSDLKGM